MTWLYTPSKYVPEWACLEKDCEPGSHTWASRCAPSVTWNGKATQPASLRRAAKKEAWTRLLSGPTYSPSTLALGVEAWTESLRASRARTSAWRAGVLASMENGLASSSTFLTSPTLAVRGFSFWRTSQASLLPPPPLWTKPKGISKSERLPASWENWPSAGGTRNGSLFPRPTWAPAMGASGGSALRGENWPTPQVGTGENSHGQISGDFRNRMEEILAGPKWATPDCNTSTYSNGLKGPNIREQAMAWPTPSASVANDGESPETWHARAAKLKEKHGNGNGAGLPLTVAASQWPTPNAHVIEHKSKPPITDGTRKPSDPQISTADIAVHCFDHSSLPALSHPNGPESSSSGPNSPRRLNPLFTESLMGWPSQWTKAEPSASSAAATALWRSALRQRLSNLLAEPACDEWKEAA